MRQVPFIMPAHDQGSADGDDPIGQDRNFLGFLGFVQRQQWITRARGTVRGVVALVSFCLAARWSRLDQFDLAMISMHNPRFPSLLFLCLFPVAAGTQQPEPAAPASNRTYELESGDQIEIRFFYNPELNEKVEIRPDGMISMPLIGQVRVAGRTVEEFTATLKDLYRPIVKQADVTVQVRSYSGRKFIVGGDVQRPGVFPLLGSQTVLGAIMEAGGLKATSKRDKVILVRRNKSGAPEAHEIALSWSGKQLPPAATMAIQPYDVVLVDESGAAKANRFIEQNITKMMPFVISAGFTYLVGGTFIR